MNIDRIKEIIEKIPISLLLVVSLAYLAFDYYNFGNDSSSPKLMKLKEIEVAKEGNLKLDAKIKQMKEFVKTLELKKNEIRRLALELQEMKGTLSENIDVPQFMKMTLTEAKKVGMTIGGLKPLSLETKEYYAEQSFEFIFKGVFAQVVTFFERLSLVSEIVRIEDFEIKTLGSSQGKFVQLEGTVQLKTYKYLGTKADSVGKDSQMPNAISEKIKSDTTKVGGGT